MTEIITTYLPLALSGGFSFLAWLINRHLRNIERIATHVDSIRDTLAATTVGLSKAEAAMAMQHAIINEHIKSITKIDTKLDAVFRYIDAPHRKTDNK